MADAYRTAALSRLSVEDLRHHLSGHQSRRLAHNTYAELDPDGSVGVRFHTTRILTFHPADTFTVSSGGWRTVTTKQRLNALLPAGYRIHSNRFAWYITTPEGVFPFEDGDEWKTGEPCA